MAIKWLVFRGARLAAFGRWTTLGAFILVGAGMFQMPARADGSAPGPRWWNDAVENALSNAGTNRSEIANALNAEREDRRDGMAFLVENMPKADLRRLSSAFLLENTYLAYEGWESAPWRSQISKEMFLNDVLPYSNVAETREPWRRNMREIAAPLVKDCRTPAEAARRLNEKLFPLVKVKYSTRRKKADQSPSESMKSGLASCTGLSILLVDACRAVGVPARLAGVKNWIDDRGNHTWVEVWDGQWHFAGAAEPDPNGLDHGWFQHDASLADQNSPEHAVYAVSFARTQTPFPAAFGHDQEFVSAVNVTERYAAPKAAVKTGQTRLMVKVMDQVGGKRVTAQVRVLESGRTAPLGEGATRDERFDTNDLLSFALASGGKYTLDVTCGSRQLRREIVLGASVQELATVYVNQPESSVLPGCAMPAAVVPAVFGGADKK
jgi:transglutaminase-like putative cysteine protease